MNVLYVRLFEIQINNLIEPANSMQSTPLPVKIHNTLKSRYSFGALLNQALLTPIIPFVHPSWEM